MSLESSKWRWEEQDRTEKYLGGKLDRIEVFGSRRLWAGWLEMPLIHSWERFLCTERTRQKCDWSRGGSWRMPCAVSQMNFSTVRLPRTSMSSDPHGSVSSWSPIPMGWSPRWICNPHYHKLLYYSMNLLPWILELLVCSFLFPTELSLRAEAASSSASTPFIHSPMSNGLWHLKQLWLVIN